MRWILLLALGCACERSDEAAPEPEPERAERPVVPVSEPIIGEGPIPKRVIEAVIARSRSKLGHCYPGLTGTVTMSWRIDATGAVDRVEVANSTLSDAQVGDCMAAEIRTWRFPPPLGGGVVEVKYPFELR